MASTTKTFLKSRVSKPTPGKWSSGFSAVKKYSEDNKIPMIAVWSNGDACGHCTMFETAVMNSKFTKWMGTSKCVFWFGCSSDTSKDDKFEGTGFTWTRNGKLTAYPFVRVYWKAGKVDKYESGDYWIDKKSSGYTAFINKLESLLKKFLTAPAPTPAPTPEPEPAKPETQPGSSETECENCEVQNDCSELKKEIENLKAENKSLKEELEMTKGISMSYMAQVQEAETNLAKTKETLSDFVGDLQELVNKMTVKLDS